jgi:hypothetical protein
MIRARRRLKFAYLVHLFVIRARRLVRSRYARLAADALMRKHQHASNIIGRYWKRFREKSVLEIRFELRKKVSYNVCMYM